MRYTPSKWKEEQDSYKRNTRYWFYFLIAGLAVTSLVAQYNNWILN